MENDILAVLIQEGSRFASELLRNRTPVKAPITPESLEKFVMDSDLRLNSLIDPVKATTIATGCVPCSLGHVGTCSGLLNESIRFSHGPDGLKSPEVIDRINMCLDELNTMERVDLRPEMTTQLKGWEKELAERALTESRNIRHSLEGLQKIEELEQAAAKTQTIRQEIGRSWYQNKLANLTPDDKAEISRRVMAKIEEMATTESEE